MPCCDSVVLLVSKKTIHAFVGAGGAGGGFCRDMFWVDSPHAVRRRTAPTRADKLLSISILRGLLCSLRTLRHSSLSAAATVGTEMVLVPVGGLGSSPRVADKIATLWHD